MKKQKHSVGRKIGPKSDFSNRVVLIMLIMVITLSILSIVAYISVLHLTAELSYQRSAIVEVPQNQGILSLEIIKPPITTAILDQPKTVSDK